MRRMRPQAIAAWCALILAVASAARAEPVILDGVPQMGWLMKQPCQRISALATVLTYLGSPATYDELMVASGAAFAIAWLPGRFDYAAIWACPEDTVVNGALAVGAEAERRRFATQEELWTALCESLDDGRPVIAWHWAGNRIICGYDPDGMQLYTQPNNNQGGEYQPVDLNSVFTQGPPGGTSDFVFVRFDPATVKPERDWQAILKRALAFADWPADKPVGGQASFGLAAYDAWIDTLRAGPDEKQLATALELTGPVAYVFADARRAAAALLTEDATLHTSFSEAADHYRTEADDLKRINQLLAARNAAETFGRTNAAWEGLAQQLELARAEEVQAVDALRVAYEELWGATPPPQSNLDATQAAGAQIAADRCRQAQSLKAERRYAEAAEELAAAIEADPKSLSLIHISEPTRPY